MTSKYVINNTLASGSTGIVKKATYLDKSYAIKIISLKERARKDVIKEIKIHSMVHHPNIIKLIDYFELNESFSLVMQLADIELFDLIEPDEGLHATLIHFYFRQLLSAVTYLHKNGIVHRDIKPENILLDRNGNLLLSDFGYSTLFMYKGKKRRMNSVVGSYRYMAPEVLNENYDEKIDIWSMGVVLLVIFTGKTPWDRPSIEDDDFVTFLQMRDHDYSPFNKLSPQMLKLFKKMCKFDSKERITLEKLSDDDWIKNVSEIEDSNGRCKDKYLLMNFISPKIVSRVSFSQPEKINNATGFKRKMISSQPNINTFDLPSLKRVYVDIEIDILVKEIEKILTGMIVPFVTNDTTIVFNTVDKMRIDMIGEINLNHINNMSCVSFVRVKGDCIEFKRFFNIISQNIKNL